MNNLDDFLNSMGITSTEDTHTTQEPEPQVVQVVVEDPEPEVQSLTQDDFDDILSGMGFVETTDNNESTTHLPPGKGKGTFYRQDLHHPID